LAAQRGKQNSCIFFRTFSSKKKLCLAQNIEIYVGTFAKNLSLTLLFSFITGRAVSSVNQYLLTVATLSVQYRFKRPILNPGLSELYELRKCYK
jgi:hypothetical protein